MTKHIEKCADWDARQVSEAPAPPHDRDQASRRPVWVTRAAGAWRDAMPLLPHLEAVVLPQPNGIGPSGGTERSGMPQDDSTDAQAISEEEAAVRRRIAQAVAEEATRWQARLSACQTELEVTRSGIAAAEAAAREHGYQAGLAQGERDGRVAFDQTHHTLLDQLASLVDGARWNHRTALHDARATLTQLSLEVAHALFGEAIAHDPLLLARRVSILIDRMEESARATVRVHPADLPLIAEHWPAVLAQSGGSAGWPGAAGGSGASGLVAGPLRLLADEQIERGGCVIETRTQYLDGQPTALLALVREVFAQTDGPLLASDLLADEGGETLADPAILRTSAEDPAAMTRPLKECA